MTQETPNPTGRIVQTIGPNGEESTPLTLNEISNLNDDNVIEWQIGASEEIQGGTTIVFALGNLQNPNRTVPLGDLGLLQLKEASDLGNTTLSSSA